MDVENFFYCDCHPLQEKMWNKIKNSLDLRKSKMVFFEWPWLKKVKLD